MDVEKTIEFLLENQARMDARMEASFVRSEARFAKADERFAKAEKRLDRIERLVTQLATAGLRFRNEIRRAQLDTEKQTKVLTGKLNSLVDRHA
ncbi:MAG: hypothetical protein ACRD3O_15360, partial [Terriglobia bacterium]